ncbi:putative bifunctional diguanylate cyclase/phosphodiesterase [Deinococcus aquiradiocola]|uniref:Uncharacterized protein n=1 Tax=Deinococcus aquiradiocola TaxID=393059 RepID=A0A917P7K0_9DEIO|nr:EAL domain-containing protein [Deinococcus aquiradiocola]GGJ65554.1 hypothetical protein GCM10008939_06900 [Deinococcus aquiradiocola]
MHFPHQDVTEAAFNITAALIVVLNRTGHIVRFNAACERLTGHREADVIGQLLWPLVLDESEAQRARETYKAMSPHSPIGPYQNYWMTPHGERRYINWQTTHLFAEDGEIDLLVATGIDVTEERAVQLALKDSEHRFRVLFDQSGEGGVLIDPHDPVVPWRIVECNATFATMNGYAHHELIGQSIDLLHEDDLMAREGPALLEFIRECGDDAKGEGTHVHRDGHVFPVESASRLVVLGGKELVLGIDRDITARKRTETQLKALNERLTFDAHHDALTGLPNRILLTDCLTQELARRKRNDTQLAVMFVDLDDFKRVNDSLGHAAGDALLREVTERVKTTLRPSDTVARVGGDEFVILVPELSSLHHAGRIARRVQEAVMTPIFLAGMTVTVGCSIGITLCPQDGQEAGDLLRQADIAMYEIKKSGKNAVQFFTPSMNEAAQDRLRLESRLRTAIAGGDLTLHYQPQVDVLTGNLVGLEALARWTDQELGTVPPDQFIPVAEDTGLIVALGVWALDEACRQAAEWEVKVPIAVNVSPAQLIREEFPDVVRDTLARYGLPPRLLKLELTERLTIRDPVLAARQLGRLRDLGVRLSLDDFGAGQSVIASLMRLPLHELKLDRMLLANITEDPSSWGMMEALLSLAQSLDLPVVVEGVETSAQLNAMRAMGCGTVQGYLTGRPQHPASVFSLLSAGSPDEPNPS